MEDFKQLSEQLKRIEETQEKILKFLEEFKSVTKQNFEIIASNIRKQ